MSEDGTEQTEGAQLDLENVIALSKGAEIVVEYPSVYSDETQSLSGVVGDVYKHKSTTDPITWFEIPLKPPDEQRLRSRKRECYRDHDHLRRLAGYVGEGAGAFVTVEALNGGRWHNITDISRSGPEITIRRLDAHNDCSVDTEADRNE